MTIIADRGLFVRILTASGKVQPGEAEAFADALDGASKDPATKADVAEVRAEVALLAQRMDGRMDALEMRLDGAEKRLDVRIDSVEQRLSSRIDSVEQHLSTRIDSVEQRLSARLDASGDRLLLRLGGLMIALIGALFAALRLTQH